MASVGRSTMTVIVRLGPADADMVAMMARVQRRTQDQVAHDLLRLAIADAREVAIAQIEGALDV
jgi:biotin synthase-related radical SAM superfamily protein